MEASIDYLLVALAIGYICWWECRQVGRSIYLGMAWPILYLLFITGWSDRYAAGRGEDYGN